MRRESIIQICIVAIAVGTLEAFCRTGVINAFTMIAPSQMVMAMIALPSKAPWFWPDLFYTLRNLGVAISIAIVLGFALGVFIHAIPRLRRVLEPVLLSYYSIPTFILYPLLIVMLGIGPASLIAMGTIFGIVGMISATMIAMDRIPRVLLKVGKTARLGPAASIFLLKLPAMAPHLFTGVKLTVAYCLIGIVAGEFILATAGFGRRLSLAYNNFDNQTMYGILLMIILFAALVNVVLNAVERRVHQRWYG